MQIAIIILGIIAAVLFILSVFAHIFHWSNFRFLALGFLASAIMMFVLMIIRNAKEGWEVGSYKGDKKQGWF